MRTALAALVSLALAVAAHAQPLTTAFSYQGRLDSNGSPASGAYDFRFTLYDAAAGGTQMGPILCVDNLSVAAGVFTAQLDFGSQFSGQQRFLEIWVRAHSGVGCGSIAGFTTLSPRQGLSGTPNALFSLSATNAVNAGSAINASQLNSQPASFYLNASNLTAGTLPDARLSTNVGTLNTPQTISATKTFSSAPAFTGAGAPFTVTSGTVVTNLNTDRLDGLDSGEFVQIAASQTITGQKTFTGNTYLNGFVGFGGAVPLGTANFVMNQNTSSFGGMYINTSGASGFPFYGYAQGGSSVAYHYIDGQDAGKWKLFLNLAPRLTVTGQGDVGIGTASPSNHLTVAQESDSNCFIAVNSGSTAAQTSGLRLSDRGTAFWTLNKTTSNDFVVREVGPSADRLYVEQGGNVGVGTSSPVAKLDINGSCHIDTELAIGTPYAIVGMVQIEGGSRDGIILSVGSTHDNVSAVRASADGANSEAVFGQTASTNGIGVMGWASASSGSTKAVYGTCSSGSGYGVYSDGRFAASGTKSFQIDHPLDPANKYLNHYCEEGPEPLNVYRGTARLDEHGEATIELPAYFTEINKDPSYTLTAVGSPMPALYVSSEIADNRFTISGGVPNGKVCWRVEAARNDRFVRTYGAPVEQDKADRRGTYLQPALYDQPPEKGLSYRPAPPVVSKPARN